MPASITPRHSIPILEPYDEHLQGAGEEDEPIAAAAAATSTKAAASPKRSKTSSPTASPSKAKKSAAAGPPKAVVVAEEEGFHYEFGGPVGAFGIVIFLPLVVLGLYYYCPNYM